MGKIASWDDIENNGLYSFKDTPTGGYKRCPTKSMIITECNGKVEVNGSYKDNQLVELSSLYPAITYKTLRLSNYSRNTITWAVPQTNKNGSIASGEESSISIPSNGLVSVSSQIIESGYTYSLNDLDFSGHTSGVNYSDFEDDSLVYFMQYKSLTIINNTGITLNGIDLFGSDSFTISSGSNKTVQVKLGGVSLSGSTNFNLSDIGDNLNDYTIKLSDVKTISSTTATKYVDPTPSVTYKDIQVRNSLDEEIFYTEVDANGAETTQEYINPTESKIVRFYQGGQWKVGTNTKTIHASIVTDSGIVILSEYLTDILTTIDINDNLFTDTLEGTNQITIEQDM